MMWQLNCFHHLVHHISMGPLSESTYRFCACYLYYMTWSHEMMTSRDVIIITGTHTNTHTTHTHRAICNPYKSSQAVKKSLRPQKPGWKKMWTHTHTYTSIHTHYAHLQIHACMHVHTYTRATYAHYKWVHAPGPRQQTTVPFCLWVNKLSQLYDCRATCALPYFWDFEILASWE